MNACRSYIHSCIHAYIHREYADIHTYIHTWINACICIYTYTHIHTCVHTRRHSQQLAPHTFKQLLESQLASACWSCCWKPVRRWQAPIKFITHTDYRSRTRVPLQTFNTQRFGHICREENHGWWVHVACRAAVAMATQRQQAEPSWPDRHVASFCQNLSKFEKCYPHNADFVYDIVFYLLTRHSTIGADYPESRPNLGDSYIM